MSADAKEPLQLFYCYSHKDKAFRDELDNHLSNLKRQNNITSWSDLEISPGTDWEKEIDNQLNTAHIILLLTSADFIASNYCYSIEMKRALDRHKAGTARVIPIILRPHDWQGAPYSFLQALPTNAKPVSKWQDQDDAFFDIVRGIRKTIEELQDIIKRSKQQQRKPYPTIIRTEQQQRKLERLVSGEERGELGNIYDQDRQEIEIIMKEILQEKDKDHPLDYLLFTTGAFLNTWLSFPRDEDGLVTETAYIDQTRFTAAITINRLNRTLAITQSRNLLDEKISGEILNIIKGLRLLEVKRLYLDEGKSWREFCGLADEISINMRNVMDQVRKIILPE